MIENLTNMLKNCRLCARDCGINRLEEELGFCGSGEKIKVAKAYLHTWEEPCISGSKGPGTVFFSNCNLKCIFCQNHVISHDGFGIEISNKEMSRIFLELQEKGAHNINLVTPTHYVPQIIESIKIAKNNGLIIPIVYNTNSYEKLDTLKALAGYIDIYLPDLKYYNDKYSLKYSNASHYFETAGKNIKEMFNQVGKPQFDKNGLMKKGVIVRHLMLPGLLFDSKKIIDFISENFGNSVYLSLMNQYTPMYKANLYEEINKPINNKHYDALIDYCILKDLNNVFIQDSGTSSENYTPDFDLKGIISTKKNKI